MPTVTLSFLRRQLEPACRDARDAFLLRYPEGVALLHEVVAALAEHPCAASWFDWLMTYHKDLEPFRATYDGAVRPALVAYLEKRRAARAAHLDKTLTDEARRPARDAYLEAVRPIRTAYIEAVRTALLDIARQLAEQEAAAVAAGGQE